MQATPGSHPLIRASWIGAAALLAVAGGLAFMGGARAALAVLAAAAILFAASLAWYLVRHLAFEREVGAAESALDALDLERARAVLAPMLDRYAHLPVVQRAAGRALYALGDPLAAASFLEKAARSYGGDPVIATALVACYAALNRGGDARRASALSARHVDVRLALAWGELVALGGDRAVGAAMVRELRDRADVRAALARGAMAAALSAVAAAHGHDGADPDAALVAVAAARAALPAFEAAFIGYLEGVALRELGRTDEAVTAFERAIETAPRTIGEALARRELANLRARLASQSSLSSSQPSTD